MKPKLDPVAFAAELARGRALADEFGKVTDRLNKEITTAEKAISDLKLGVYATVLVSSAQDPEDSYPTETYLSFGKLDQEWRLYIEEGDQRTFLGDPSGPSPSVVPLVNAPRRTRVEAVKHLQALVTKLIEVAQHELKQVQDSLEEVAAFTTALKSGGVLK